MGCSGRTFQDCTICITGCLGEEPKVGKRIELVDLGTNMGKQREKRIKVDAGLYTGCWSEHC